MALVPPFDEFHVGYTMHQPERTDDLTAQAFQGELVLGSTRKRAGGGYAAFVIDVQWRATIAVGLGKNYLVSDDKGIDMIHIAGDVALQQIVGLLVTKRIQTGP